MGIATQVKSYIVFYIIFWSVSSVLFSNNFEFQMDFNIPENGVLTLIEGTHVNFKFNVTYNLKNPKHLIKIDTFKNETLTITDCRFYVDCSKTIYNKTCRCLFPGGPYQFTKTVHRSDDKAIYMWLAEDKNFNKHAQRNITFNVTYPSRVTKLIVDNEGGSSVHAVLRNQSLTVVCHWENGNPPTIPRILDSEGKYLKNTTVNRAQVIGQHSVLHCNFIERIRCEADGSARNMSTTVLTKCPPEFSNASVGLQSVNIGENAVFRFQLYAHTTAITKCQITQLTERIMTNSSAFVDNHDDDNRTKHYAYECDVHLTENVMTNSSAFEDNHDDDNGTKSYAYECDVHLDKHKCWCHLTGTVPNFTLHLNFQSIIWKDCGLWSVNVSNEIGSDTKEFSIKIIEDNLETIRDDLKKKENPQLQSEDVANLVSKVEQNLGGNATVSTSNETKVVVDILNELFQTSTEELKTAESTNGSASRLLGMVETLLTKVELTNDQFQTTSTQLFVAVRQNVTSGLTLTAYDKDFNGNFEGDEVKIDFNSEVPKEESVNSLVLPDSLFTNNNLSSSRIILVSYLSDNLYEVVRQAHAGNQTKAPKDTSYVRKINSHVLAASIIGSNFILTDPIVITLVHHEKNSKNATCVFWNDTQKDWSTKGCELDSSSSTQFRSSCRCDHLTSFALLMDVYQEGESSSVLSALSIIGCCVSLSSLLITIITYGILIALGDKRPCLKERREQRDVPHKILLNLCSALVLSNVVYLTGWIEHIPKPPVVCKVAAAMLHFFLLGAFCWMAVEAYYMYLVLVQVFKTNFTNFALKCSIFGWGVPLLVVAITLGVNKTDNYQNIQDNVCWLKGIAFYVAFVTPVCLVLVMNFAIFGLVLRRMMGLSGNKSISGPSFTVKRQLRGAIGVIILLGLTWIFAFLNTNKASPVFAYLFVIFNPLQGTFIFLYYCIMREDIRVIWLRWLYCGQADVIVISNQEDFTSRNAEQEHEKHPENSGKYQVLEEASTNRILQKANSKKNKRPGSKLAVDTSKTTMTTVSESIADSEI